ncbi:hypothetical protein BRADI_2g39895v3 [Brachypodium distachyon]|uniref:Uncharacterized protein n=1 Tax=Brachypodium distachyon TaxID=15368 RepID=A0A0Q3J689_BRADI|nr:hypothetical protein BRADI_2g39895v3 [Brachypodium distachyon]
MDKKDHKQRLVPLLHSLPDLVSLLRQWARVVSSSSFEGDIALSFKFIQMFLPLHSITINPSNLLQILFAALSLHSGVIIILK